MKSGTCKKLTREIKEKSKKDSYGRGFFKLTLPKKIFPQPLTSENLNRKKFTRNRPTSNSSLHEDTCCSPSLCQLQQPVFRKKKLTKVSGFFKENLKDSIMKLS